MLLNVGYEKDLANRSSSFDTVSSAENRVRAPKLKEYSRSSSIAMNKSDSSHSFSEMFSTLNPFKARKNSGDK
uniref:Uncharacterized protein n=1 Tax=Panagrolaimus sp. PS1159 TaxID=55785 RepID=A0AC35FG23_9BILA